MIFLIRIAVFAGIAWGIACLVVLASVLLWVVVSERKRRPAPYPKLELVRDRKADIGPALRRPR